MSVRRDDGSEAAAVHFSNFAEFRNGSQAHLAGQGYDPDQGEHWRDGWIHAAELAQSKVAILRHLPLLRDALLGSYRLLKNMPKPAKGLSYLQQKDRDTVLTNINLALAHVPTDSIKDNVL